MKRQSCASHLVTGLMASALLVAGLCSVTACQSAVKDFYDPLLKPRCEGGAGGQTTSQGGATQGGSGEIGGSAGAGGECAAP